ncbi:MAG TPA: condensation domain-containing protein, partial [Chloroflexota bacterium]|nr:condensation domain-containing protein [Chloroflexota bacterium]
KITPAHLDLLSHELSPDDAAGCARAFVIGGEALHREQLAFWQEHAPNTRLINEYGPTETVVGCCVSECSADSGGQSAISIGRPIANTQLHILTPELGLASIGCIGELYIGGDGVCRGYLNRPDLTAERFVPDPFGSEPGARLYRTGDLCRYLPDGNIEFLGRIDHQVKVRGFRIELGEIESVLLACPGVREAVVLAREDAPGHKRLVAYVVADDKETGRQGERETSGLSTQHSALSTGSSALSTQHSALLRAKLPDYMVPSAYVYLEALPLTPNGKVDRKALPAPDGPVAESTFEAPTSHVEETLAAIWSQVLRLERVGIRDNFFELGGDSILSIQIVSRAKQSGLTLTPRQVFQHQTIAELAAVAGEESEIEAEQGEVTGDAALTPIQRWFFEQQLAEPHHFNQARLLKLRSEVTAEMVELAAAELVRHHDALRLRFARTPEGGWTQRIASVEEANEAPVFTMQASSLSTQHSALSTLQASLHLEHGPIARIAYLDMGPGEEARLLIAIHHLAVDGVSWRVLLEDLQTLLEQSVSGSSSGAASSAPTLPHSHTPTLRLPPKTTSLRAWSQRLQEYASSSELGKEAEYWLRPMPAVAPL